jgi:protein-disulfide isomerase
VKTALATFLAAGLVVAAPALRQTDPTLLARTKGRSDAPVTVYEMADFQCPACRLFAVTVFPTLEREFIETGKVRWVFINFPLTSIHPNAVAAAEVAMCAGQQQRFWPAHDALYQHQDSWAALTQPRDTLVALMQRAGVDRPKLLACLRSGTMRTAIDQEAERVQRTGARSTPSFYIEGGLLEGAPYTPDPMRQVLDSVYAAKTSGPRS